MVGSDSLDRSSQLLLCCVVIEGTHYHTVHTASYGHSNRKLFTAIMVMADVIPVTGMNVWAVDRSVPVRQSTEQLHPPIFHAESKQPIAIDPVRETNRDSVHRLCTESRLSCNGTTPELRSDGEVVR
jgi:hypothetical protein